MDIDLFVDILNVDSTTSKERGLSDLLIDRLQGDNCTITHMPQSEAKDAPANLLLTWGEPVVTYCTHLDTVPPYIPPTRTVDSDGNAMLRGRGTCDAKGQIISMLTACRQLAQEGQSGYGLLLLHGEETGSYGAKEFSARPGGEYVVVGEPTDNLMATASKGTKSFKVTIRGKAAHSGYPQQGVSAVDLFVDLANRLRNTSFPLDPVLGPTTYNIGKLCSDNPQNILSPELSFRIYFRTTFATDQMVTDLMMSLAGERIEVEAYGGDTPSRYFTVPGIGTTTVAFGSDAPQLTNYKHKALVGPGSILVAHTPDEHILLDQLNKAVDNYIKIFYHIKHKI